jgi:hypothetical protein
MTPSITDPRGATSARRTRHDPVPATACPASLGAQRLMRSSSRVLALNAAFIAISVVEPSAGIIPI